MRVFKASSISFGLALVKTARSLTAKGFKETKSNDSNCDFKDIIFKLSAVRRTDADLAAYRRTDMYFAEQFALFKNQFFLFSQFQDG